MYISMSSFSYFLQTILNSLEDRRNSRHGVTCKTQVVWTVYTPDRTIIIVQIIFFVFLFAWIVLDSFESKTLNMKSHHG